MIYSLYLISKSGSLLYQKDFNEANSPIPKQDSNNYLILASNLHGIFTISSKITPKNINRDNKNRNGVNLHSNKSGLRVIETELFKIFIHQTVSGLKIILFTSKDLVESDISRLQIDIFKCYSNYVLKNPFYNLGMPIRIELFDLNINKLITSSL